MVSVNPFIMARNTKRRSNYSRNRGKATQNQARNHKKNDLSSSPVEPEPILIDKRKLRDGALERAKNRPIYERILTFFRREKNKDYKELIINTEALERRVNVLKMAFFKVLMSKDWMKIEWLGRFLKEKSKT